METSKTGSCPSKKTEVEMVKWYCGKIPHGVENEHTN